MSTEMQADWVDVCASVQMYSYLYFWGVLRQFRLALSLLCAPQADIKLMAVLLSPPPNCGDYRQFPLHPASYLHLWMGKNPTVRVGFAWL